MIRDIFELEKLVESHYTPCAWQLNTELWKKKYETFETYVDFTNLPWGRSIQEPGSPFKDSTWISLGDKEYSFQVDTVNNEKQIVLDPPFWASEDYNYASIFSEKTVVTLENLASLLPKLSENKIKARIDIHYGLFRGWLHRIVPKLKAFWKDTRRKVLSPLYVSGYPYRGYEHPCAYERGMPRVYKFLKMYYGPKTWLMINLTGGYYEKQVDINWSRDPDGPPPLIEHHFKLKDKDIEFYNSSGFGMSVDRHDNYDAFSNDLTWWQLWRTVRDFGYKSVDNNWIRDIMKISVKE